MKIHSLSFIVLSAALSQSSLATAYEIVKIDPRNVATVDLGVGEEKSSSTECAIYYGNVRDGYLYHHSIRGTPCTDELKARLIGYKRNGKPRTDSWKYHFEDTSVLSRDSVLTIRDIQGEETQFGLTEKRTNNYRVTHEPREYANRLENAKIELERIVKNAANVYINACGVCYREGAEIDLSLAGEHQDVLHVSRIITECSSVEREKLIYREE